IDELSFSTATLENVYASLTEGAAEYRAGESESITMPADEQPLAEEPSGAPQSQITPVTGMRGQRIGLAAPGSGPWPLNGRGSSAAARRAGSSRAACWRPCSVQDCSDHLPWPAAGTG